ncbi:BZ3500_MvSof-1268-A1-R1_Chr3-1g05757 [Microbotryum saponariae]|uniref:BZ3500_MvSof-1268-A1-R1_Chr3-1g05757 protein n=1 Tax=Microbotryum saponariae TaxID=289078 RepID=A0A2X0MWT8_9BASI|nr:BZ3500_MvSof-1268-A1-R1_Chr3-1g05757 [Microbotryum saponariae]SDA04947.1 BZ3501_MvSof-1269-A2-R1_Chr3-1g05427 [Microbotryum saponariae]
MADTYAIDVHCSLEACRTLDLLPIRCAGCTLVFCGPHAPPAQHGCSGIARATAENVQDGKRFADKFEDLLPAPQRHAFERDQMKQDQQARSKQAKEIIERNFAAVKSAHTKPLSPVVALMKLKQRAQPIDATAKRLKMEDRLYLTVRFCEGEERTVASTKEVWLGKESTGGKAIDQLAQMFDVANVNNTTTDGTKRLTLASSMNDDTCLPTSERLSQLVQNGTELVLMRGARFK